MNPTRREFLGHSAGVAGALYCSSLAGAAPAKSSRIARVETFPVKYPTAGRFKFFEDAKGRPMGRQTVVVKITADDGTIGWGQSVPTPKWSYETQETVQTTIDSHLGPLLVGMDPFDLDAIQQLMSQMIAPLFTTGQPICKAGIDLALFDLTGKLLGESAAQRWKKQGRERLTLSWTLNPKTIDDIPALVEEGRKKGYGTFNVKVAPDIEFDVRMCKEVKRLAPDGFLWADANGGYDEASALAAAPRLADAGVAVLEQPVRPNRITSLAKLKQQGALPIILDEGVVSSVDLEEFIKLDILDGVAMKPARCAGLTDARRQVEMVLERGLMFLGSGLTDPDVSLAASLLLYGAYDLKYPAALNGPQFLAGHTILKTPFVPEHGQLMIPKGVGLAVEVDESRLRPS